MDIIFNNKNSFIDFNIFIDSFSISAPPKKKIKESVPFMNSNYDFSTIGSNGEIVYDDRIITVKFNLIEKNRSNLWDKYSQVLEWLIGTGQQQLIFTEMLDCYYLAEVESAPSFQTVLKKKGIMDVTFVAYPFKYGVSEEGSNQLWDSFSFSSDYMQETSFDVPGSKTVQIYNSGRVLSPLVTCNSSMTATINGYTANFIAGDNVDYSLKFLPGLNEIVINGTGHIEFKFRKELL